MRIKLLKQFLLTLLSLTASFIFAQDQVKLNSIKVNGVTYSASSTVTLYKGTSASITVNYTIIKNTPSWQQAGIRVNFYSKMLTGSPHLIQYENQSWPSEQYVTKTYEFTANITNTDLLIENNDQGKLFLVYEYGTTNTTSNSINVNFIQPSVSSNTISGNIVADYLTTGSTIVGSDVSVPVGSYKVYWQRKNPVSNGYWYNISSGTINTKDYTPLAAENRYHYKVRRLVHPTAPGINDSYSNEIDVRVNIGENFITESSGTLIGSEPKGGAGTNTYIYQWQEKINGTWTNISNATQKNYQIPSSSTNRTFRRMVSSPFAADNASNEIAITPRIIGNSIKLDFNSLYPAEQVLYGEKPIFNRLLTTYTVSSTSGQTISYQWQSKTELGNWIDIAGANSESYTINTPLYETTHLRRLANSLYTNTSESNVIIIPISGNSKTENNIISFDPSNNDHILGTIPTGGNGDFTYIWGLDVHPDDSIGEMIQWESSTNPETFLSEYIDYLPVTSDEYRITRYTISDNVWHRSNTLIYSLSGGIIQGKKVKQNQLSNSENLKEATAFINDNELNFIFKNYKNTQAEIYIGNLATGQSLKVTTFNVKNDIDNYRWNFPSHYLPGVYVYRILFNDSTVQSGKVIRK